MTTPNAIDCAAPISATGAAKLKSQGILAVGRYLGPSSSWKAMQLAEVQIILNAGLKIISIFETSPNHSSYFTPLEAQQDAKNADIYAKAVKQPTGTVIFFTVDYDAANADLPTIANYFKTLITSLKDYEVGAYGGYQVIEYLKAHTSVKHTMQTVAWSGGKVDGSTDLYQYQDDTTYAGLAVDLDTLRNTSATWDLHEAITATIAAVTPERKSTTTQTVWVDYKVQSGDTVSGLAAKHNTTIAAIESKNGINPATDTIYVGQVIKIPVQKTVSTEQFYKVKSGENLSSIAANNSLSLDQIEALNPQIKSPDFVIQPGEKVRVK